MFTTRCLKGGRSYAARFATTIKVPGKGHPALVAPGSVAATSGKLATPPPNEGATPTTGLGAGDGNPFPPGYCTWGAWEKAQWLGNAVHGNADDWANEAAAHGLAVDKTPVVDAVYVRTTGGVGHVAVVTGIINATTFTVVEMNGGSGATAANDWKTSEFGVFKYGRIKYTGDNVRFIYKPGTAPGSAGGGSTGGGGGGGSTGPPTPANPTLVIVSPLSVSAPQGFFEYRPLIFSFSAKAPVGGSIKQFSVPVRGPAGDALDVACANGAGVPMSAGQVFTCTADLEQGYGSPGTFTYWADWQGYDGSWHDGQLGPHEQFTLSAAPPPTTTTTTTSTPTCGAPNGHTLALVGSPTVSSDNSFKEFAGLAWTYTVCNVSGVAASINKFEIAVRGPAGDALDVPCDSGQGVTLQAGQTWACHAYLPTGYGSSGTFTWWADWLGYDGSWHEGELGQQYAMSIYPP